MNKTLHKNGEERIDITIQQLQKLTITQYVHKFFAENNEDICDIKRVYQNNIANVKTPLQVFLNMPTVIQNLHLKDSLKRMFPQFHILVLRFMVNDTNFLGNFYLYINNLRYIKPSVHMNPNARQPLNRQRPCIII